MKWIHRNGVLRFLTLIAASLFRRDCIFYPIQWWGFCLCFRSGCLCKCWIGSSKNMLPGSCLLFVRFEQVVYSRLWCWWFCFRSVLPLPLKNSSVLRCLIGFVSGKPIPYCDNRKKEFPDRFVRISLGIFLHTPRR